jgi:HEAT repeat protein
MRDPATPNDEELLFDESADVVQRKIALGKIAKSRWDRLEPEIATLLSHPEEMLRCEAIITLVGWWEMDEYIPRAMEMLTCDASEFTRSDAAFALGMFAQRTGRLELEIVRALARAVRNDPDDGVVYSAYRAIREILDPDFKASTIPDPIDKTKHVDWDVLRPYLGP